MDRCAEFRRRKKQCLSKADLSRKGSVDEDVVELVQFLNAREQFFTTSSCAGRILLLDGGINGFEVQKQNCCWLLVTHKPCVKDDVEIKIQKYKYVCKHYYGSPEHILLDIAESSWKLDTLDPNFESQFCHMIALKKASGDAILKFEPFVLHVQCQQLQDAQILHSVAIDSGFRNSGITVGKKGKTMLAVRSTHGLEVPLSHKGKLMVSEEYIDFLLNIANQKMEENKKRIERFYNCLQHALGREAITTSHPKIQEKNKPSCTHKKKRNLEKAGDKCTNEENDKELENDDDSPGINISIFPEDY